MENENRTGGSYPELFPEDFGERLERLIELAGLSREEFAQRIGVGDDRVAEWREGCDTHRRGGVARRSAGVVGPRRHGGYAAGGRRGWGVAT